MEPVLQTISSLDSSESLHDDSFAMQVVPNSAPPHKDLSIQQIDIDLAPLQEDLQSQRIDFDIVRLHEDLAPQRIDPEPAQSQEDLAPQRINPDPASFLADPAPDLVPPNVTPSRSEGFKPMTPNTRKRKSRLSRQVTEYIRDLGLPREDEVDVLKLSLKQLGVYKMLQSERKPTKLGRAMTSLETRAKVWDFWHDSQIVSASTLTSRPAKMKVGDRPKIQSGLPFDKVPITIVQVRKRPYYEAPWLTLECPLKELYANYIKENPNHYVSYGTWFALRPFYIRQVTTKDIEMCCCKLHLHARYSVSSLIACCKKQEISLNDITDYDSFFKTVTSECGSNDTTYIDWKCTQDKKNCCDHIKGKWSSLANSIISKSDEKITVPFTQFVKKPHTTKKGKEILRLEPEGIDVNLNFLVDFISKLLPTIIHHRNQLKHFRSTIKECTDMFDCIEMHVDYSEKLTVTEKHQPQSLHWHEKKVIVHAGIVIESGEKSYHPYMSDDLLQDYVFVDIAINEMLSGCSVEDKVILIKSDNCSKDYKCAAHFDTMQRLADKYHTTVLRIYEVAGHGKGPVDHVGGIAKVKVRREVAAGNPLRYASEMVEFLTEKFKDKVNPSYMFKEITSKRLETARSSERLKVFSTIEGSSKFQVIVFKPNQVMKAAPRLCLCEKCKVDYGSCQLFEEYAIMCNHLKRNCLRSDVADSADMEDDEENDEEAEQVDVLVATTVVALAADKKSFETFYLIEITQEESPAMKDETDHWGKSVKVE